MPRCSARRSSDGSQLRPRADDSARPRERGRCAEPRGVGIGHLGGRGGSDAGRLRARGGVYALPPCSCGSGLDGPRGGADPDGPTAPPGGVGIDVTVVRNGHGGASIVAGENSDTLAAVAQEVGATLFPNRSARTHLVHREAYGCGWTWTQARSSRRAVPERIVVETVSLVAALRSAGVSVIDVDVHLPTSRATSPPLSAQRSSTKLSTRLRQHRATSSTCNRVPRGACQAIVGGVNGCLGLVAFGLLFRGGAVRPWHCRRWSSLGSSGRLLR